MADVYLTMYPTNQQIGHTWKTGVQYGIKGNEKRSALFTFPRIRSNLILDFHEYDQMAWIFRKLYRHTHEIWGIPLFPDKTLLTSQASSGQKIITVAATGDRHFYAGRDVILIDPSDWTSYEVGTIDTIDSATQITVLTNLTSTWSAGTMLIPVYDMRIQQKQKLTRMAYKHKSIQLQAVEEYETSRSFSYSLPSSGADTYLSYDVFLIEPIAPIEFSIEHPFDLTQWLGIGYGYSNFNDADSLIQMTYSLRMNSRSDIFDLYNFFDSKRGRFDYLWVPSWNRDLIVTSAITSTDQVLTVQDFEYDTYFYPNTVIGRHLFIRFPDKTYDFFKVTAATSNTITIDAAIGQDVAAGDLDKMLISFLHWGRFAIDELMVDYALDNKAASDVVLVNLVQDTPA